MDAAAYSTKEGAFARASTKINGQTEAIAQVRTKHLDVAGEAAIALTLTATIQFTRGRITKTSFNILKNAPVIKGKVALGWLAAHSLNQGNEIVHKKARGCTGRAVGHVSQRGMARDIVDTYQEITQPYRLNRLAYPTSQILT